MALSAEHGLAPHQGQLAALESGILPERYLRNFPTIDLAGHLRLARARVLLVGLGGLGGYILEILARSGTGNFVLADGDVFEESNLNRQILGTVDNLEKPKVKAAQARLEIINPFCRCTAMTGFLDKHSLTDFLREADLVIDALGGIEFRPALLEATSRAGLPLVTGFVAGTTGLASVIYPGSKDPGAFWQGSSKDGAEEVLGNMAAIVSLIASVQAGEAIKILVDKESGLMNRMFLADLGSLTFDLLKL